MNNKLLNLLQAAHNEAVNQSDAQSLLIAANLILILEMAKQPFSVFSIYTRQSLNIAKALRDDN